MPEEVFLFKKRPVEDYIQSLQHQIISEIATIVDGVNSFKNTAALKKTIQKKYTIDPVTINYEAVQVQPFFREKIIDIKNKVKEVWVKYTLPYTGSGVLLTINSCNNITSGCRIIAALNDSHFSFEIYAEYINSLTLPDDKKMVVNQKALFISDHINKELTAVNARMESYNNELPNLVSNIFEEIKLKAEEKSKAVDDLNPFRKSMQE